MNRAESEPTDTSRSSVQTFRTFLTVPTFLSLLRRIAGMPDYGGHVERLRRCHPEQPIPTEGEFYEEYLRARYSEGPTRCC